MQKVSERQKIQGVLERIENDSFSPDDVDLLLIKLREYSLHGSIFQELSHFAAHNDNRNIGFTFSHISGFFNSIVFHMKHLSGNTPIIIETPVSSYIVETIIYNIKASRIDFPETYKCSYDSFMSRFKNTFEKIKGSDTYKVKSLIKGTVKKVIEDMLQKLIAQPLFTQEEIINQIIETLELNNFVFDSETIRQRSDRVILYIMLLMHGTEYNINKQDIAKSVLHVTNVEDKKVLQLFAYFMVPDAKYPNKLLFPLISTNIDPDLYCSSRVIDINIHDVDMCGLILNKENKLDLIE